MEDYKKIIDSVPEGPNTNKSKSLWTWVVGFQTVGLVVLFSMLVNRPTQQEGKDAAVFLNSQNERLILERNYFQRAVDSCEAYRLREANDCNNRILDLLDFKSGKNKITIIPQK